MDAMLEYEAMKREEAERVKNYYAKQNRQRQWIVDASSTVNFEVVVWANTKEEAIAKAKESLKTNDDNVYEDYGEIKIDDIMEVHQNGI